MVSLNLWSYFFFTSAFWHIIAMVREPLFQESSQALPYYELAAWFMQAYTSSKLQFLQQHVEVVNVFLCRTSGVVMKQCMSYPLQHTCYMSIKKLFKTKRACHSSGIPALGLSYLWIVRPSFSCKKTLDFLEMDVGVFSLYPRIIMEGEVPQSHKFFLSCSLSMLLFYLWTVRGDVGWGLGMILL